MIIYDWISYWIVWWSIPRVFFIVCNGRASAETIHDAFRDYYTMTSLKTKSVSLSRWRLFRTIYTHQNHRSKCENIYNYLKIYIFHQVLMLFQWFKSRTLSWKTKCTNGQNAKKRAKWISSLPVQFYRKKTVHFSI